MDNVYDLFTKKPVTEANEDKDQQEQALDELLLGLANEFNDRPKKKKKPKAKPRKNKPVSEASVNIKGDNNINGNNNTIINNHYPPNKPSTKVVIRGADVITEEEAFNIKKKVDELVRQDIAHGMTSKAAYGKWWGNLKGRYSVTEYKSIPRDKYDDAMQYLKRQAAIKRATKSSFNENDRNYYYSAIWARAKNVNYDKQHIHKLASKMTGEDVTSLTVLSLRDLKKVYNAVMSL